MGGEPGAAHTGTASVADDVDDFLRGQGVDIFARLAIRAKGILEVIFNHNRKRVGTPPVPGRGSTATTVPDTLAWMGAPRPAVAPII